MHIKVTPSEALGLAHATGVDVPPVVSSVTGEGDVVHVSADLRRLDDLPRPLRLAARVAPVVRSQVRVLEYEGGKATLAIEVNAGGLPAHRVLGLLAAPIEKLLTSKGLPAGSVDVRSDATVVVDVETLMDAKMPGLTVTGLRVADGQVHVDVSV